jgi:hypothetical protein
MKLARLLIILMSFALTSKAFSNDIDRKPHEDTKPYEDTIIVNFGKKGKMVIYVNNKEDFKALKAYDINALLSKINIYLDSTYEEDYMNDTTFTFHTPYTVKTNKQGEVKIRVESKHLSDNIEEKIEKAADDLEDAADDIEKISVRVGSLHIDINPDEKENEEKVKVYHKTPEEKRIRHYFNFHVGLNNYFEKDHIPTNETTPYTLSPFRSRYFAVDFTQKVKLSKSLFFTTGAELEFNNYMFRDEVEIRKDNGNIVFLPVERDVRKSKLATTYFNLPAMFILDINNTLKLGVGAYVGYRLGSHSKIKYTSGDDIKDKYRSNFYLNDWKYGLRGTLGIKDVKFFMNYDLNTMFRGDRDPKLNSVSFGIII